VAACEFQGTVAFVLPGEQTAEVTGSVADDLSCGGEITVDLGGTPFSQPWEGTCDGVIDATFAGSAPIDVGGYSFTVDFDGGFNATR
jgi:hypothetical protein